MEVSGWLYTTVVLSPGKEPKYPFLRRLGGFQSRSGRSSESYESNQLEHYINLNLYFLLASLQRCKQFKKKQAPYDFPTMPSCGAASSR